MRRRIVVLVWIASIALVVAGVVLIVLSFQGPKVGPSLPAPEGRTSMNTLTALKVTINPSTETNEQKEPTVDLSSEERRAVSQSSEKVTQWTSSAKALGSSTRSSFENGLPLRLDHAILSAPRSIPVHLTIPSLRISVAVSQLGLNTDGSVTVPSNFHVPGWYKFGYAPGQVGSAAILGHVDSTNGPGVFYRIVTMKVGQLVKVVLADKQTLTFKVIGLRQYSKGKFPNELVYGPSLFSALDLVTCGGVFDPVTHHYLSNIVVFTALSST
jgi:hypothetical protein